MPITYKKQCFFPPWDLDIFEPRDAGSGAGPAPRKRAPSQLGLAPCQRRGGGNDGEWPATRRYLCYQWGSGNPEGLEPTQNNPKQIVGYITGYKMEKNGYRTWYNQVNLQNFWKKRMCWSKTWTSISLSLKMRHVRDHLGTWLIEECTFRDEI